MCQTNWSQILTYMCVINIIETQASDIITLLGCYRRQEPLDGANLIFLYSAIEDGADDQVRLDRMALDAVQANITVRVD